MKTENLSTLKIHKLTQEQYDRELLNGNIDKNAIYLTPDDGSHSYDALDVSTLNVQELSINGVNIEQFIEAIVNRMMGTEPPTEA